MPPLWFDLKKKSMRRKSSHEGADGSKSLCSIMSKRRGCGRSGCSRSIANLKDVVIPGSKRHGEENPPVCSPRSVGSNELLNPITHEVVLSNSTCELRISTGNISKNFGGSDDGCNFVGMLKPGTPGPGLLHVGRGMGSPVRRSSSSLSRRSPRSGTIAAARPRCSFGPDSCGILLCHKCGEQFIKWEAVEAHHLSQHAVTELVEGDSSRKIVEIICRDSRDDNHCGRKIDRILKVHNMQTMLSQFEEYRDLVKLKAGKLPKKHPRCLADGNELLRFHGAALECNLGEKGSSSLCTSDKCRVCRILRYGFTSKRELTRGIGVFTSSTSKKALESIQETNDGKYNKALIVCRVIAGRVHKPLENILEIVGQSGFDSLAGKVGLHSSIEELYLMSPRALLPCFVVIYKS